MGRERIVGKVASLRPQRIFRPYVAGQRCGQRRAVAAVDCLAIGHSAAIEHARQLLHALGHAEIADAELANRMLDVGEEGIGQVLRHVGGVARLAAQAVQHQEHVQRDHLEAPERRVRNIPVGIKQRLPRRRHDLFVQRVRDLPVGGAGAPKIRLNMRRIS